MDSASLTVALQPPAPVGDAFAAAHSAPSGPPAPPPELVGRFEAMMARLGPAAGGDAAQPVVPSSAVAAVETHLQHYVDTMERASTLDPRSMNLVELHVEHMKNVTEMSQLSMLQTGCIQVLGSGKECISSLMKNQ
jgi:hypothetical protein